ncbi:MAG: spore coat protein U domain-containing protein [Thermoanaerobaculia bacterium]
MRAMSRSLRFVATVVVCFAAAGEMQAQCSWTTPMTTMDFGTYNVFGGVSNATTTGSVRCIGNLNVTISSTTGAAGVFNPRKMSGTASYNVYIDAGRTLIWGNGTGGSNQDPFTNTGTRTWTITEFGQVPAAQDLAPGIYNDSLTVTVAYRPSSGGAWVSLPGVALPIRMTVTAACRADTFSVTFPVYSPLSAVAVAGASTVKVYCTKTTPATFALDNGLNASGVQKRMVNAGNFLNYTATLASGSGNSTTSLAPIGGGIALNASIPAGQDLPAAATSYVDTLQVVVNY